MGLTIAIVFKPVAFHVRGAQFYVITEADYGSTTIHVVEESRGQGRLRGQTSFYLRTPPVVPHDCATPAKEGLGSLSNLTSPSTERTVFLDSPLGTC